MNDHFGRRLRRAARLLTVDWSEDELRRGAERLRRAVDRQRFGLWADRLPLGWDLPHPRSKLRRTPTRPC